MKVQKYLTWVWSFLIAHWSTLLAIFSLVLVFLASVFSPLSDYLNYFLFICLNAVVLMLVDIRHQQEIAKKPARQPHIFLSMRDARPTIIKEMKTELSKKRGGLVFMSGGRIRAITELLREFSAEVGKQSNFSKTGLTINLQLMNPDYVAGLILPGAKNSEAQLDRNKSTAALVKASLNEISEMNLSPEFLNNKIKIEVTLFSNLPFSFCYIFSDRCLIMGGYSWDKKNSDLVGPTNQCWLLDSEMVQFSPVKSWLLSRFELNEATN